MSQGQDFTVDRVHAIECVPQAKPHFRAAGRRAGPGRTAGQLIDYRNWIEWSNGRLFDLWRLWDGEIRKINPGARYIANSGGGSMTTLDMKTISQIAPTLFADRQSRRGVMPPWANGKNAKEFRATFGRKPIVGIASIGVDDEHRWKDSVTTEAELRIWLADGIANGLRPWVAKFSGVVYDPRWLTVVEKTYDWHHRNVRYLRNEQNLARVAMVYSQQTGTYYGGAQKHRNVEDHELGLYHALVEARIPFEMAHDQLLDPEHVDRYKLLLLPNVAALSEKQCESSCHRSSTTKWWRSRSKADARGEGALAFRPAMSQSKSVPTFWRGGSRRI